MLHFRYIILDNSIEIYRSSPYMFEEDALSRGREHLRMLSIIYPNTATSLNYEVKVEGQKPSKYNIIEEDV